MNTIFWEPIFTGQKRIWDQNLMGFYNAKTKRDSFGLFKNDGIISKTRIFHLRIFLKTFVC